MPKSLEKTRKKIAKKKGNISALHENSRDSQRLRRALMRDDKLVKVASLRRRNDQPLSEWICAEGYGQRLTSWSWESGILPGSYSEEWWTATGDGDNPAIDWCVSHTPEGYLSTTSDLMARFVHQNDEEFSKLKKERRAGRPASTREDLLRMKIAADEKERENGFCKLSLKPHK